jgi:myosin heavy subunit
MALLLPAYMWLTCMWLTALAGSEGCAALLELALGAESEADAAPRYAIGKTKVFLAAGVLGELCRACNGHLGHFAVCLQRHARGWLVRCAVQRRAQAEAARREVSQPQRGR